MFEMRRFIAGPEHYEVLFRGGLYDIAEFRSTQGPTERESCYLVYLGDGTDGC